MLSESVSMVVAELVGLGAVTVDHNWGNCDGLVIILIGGLLRLVGAVVV